MTVAIESEEVDEKKKARQNINKVVIKRGNLIMKFISMFSTRSFQLSFVTRM